MTTRRTNTPGWCHETASGTSRTSARRTAPTSTAPRSQLQPPYRSACRSGSARPFSSCGGELMSLTVRFAAGSDVGLRREGNEDSAYAGPRLLAIADGMGGAAAGEVASSVTIGALADLDNDEVTRGDMIKALAGAVSTANHTLHEMSAADPSVEGM